MQAGSNALPPAIADVLARVRGRSLRLAVATGLAYIVAAALLYQLGSFALDRSLDLPRLFRGVLLAGAGLTLVWLAWRRLFAPAREAARMTDDDAALTVERAFGLDESLISAVQLARPARADATRSEALVARVVEQVAGSIRSVDAGRAVSGRPFARGFGVALLAAAGVFALVQLDAQGAQIWWERNVLLLDTGWPRAVDMAVTVEPSRGVVALGDHVAVRAELLRGQPRRVQVRVEYERTGGVEVIPARLADTYVAAVENLSEPVRLRVEGGDYVSRWFRVDVRPRPKLEAMRVWVRYPAHTGLDDTPEDEPLTDGNLKVPEGAVVRLEARATEALASAQLTYDTEAALEQPARGALARTLDLAVDGRTVRASFRVTASTRYALRLESQDGFDSGQAAQFAITAIVDRLPEVRINKPGRNKDATPNAILPLEIALRDDYRVVDAALVHRVRKAGEPAPGAEVRVRLPVDALERDAAGSALVIEAQLALEDLAVAPDDVIEYWVEAIDARVASGRLADAAPEEIGRTRSSFLVRVVSAADLERALQARLKRVRDDLQQVERAQEAVRTDVEQAGALVVRGADRDGAARRQQTYAELDQRKVAQRLERAGAEFTAVREEMELNRVAREDDLAWLIEIEAIAGRVARGPATEAAAVIGRLRQSEAPAEADLTLGLRRQDEVSEAVRDLVRRLDRWDLFNDVVRDLRDLIRSQERLREETRRRLQQGGER